MSLAPPAADGSIEQGRDAMHHDPKPSHSPAALPPALEALERLARRELARLQSGQAMEPGHDELLLALAWDLSLAGDELPQA
ncbi:hypothetical protein [[Pseudomonas] boreopolis]|uniref:Uncharacterized protein n=1 Tax=Xanthomonas boreopolis TaxID=86183 RepID=A0A919KGG8_9XANT|nr:hypothetical protein GCM10009090_01580 [[Pseudomonas] boreopolis]